MTLKIEENGPVTFVTLNRPDVHNAFNADLISELTDAFASLGSSTRTRVIVLAGAGRSFCAGGDLNWMRSMVGVGAEQNKADSIKLAGMFETVDTCPKPVIARVQGAAIGGGVGLVSCADIVVAGPRAKFGLGEVRLGLAPAVISPFVVRKIGTSKARELFMTGDRMDAATAMQWGMVHYVEENDLSLDDRVIRLTESLLKGGPNALAACKTLAREADLWSNPTERTAALIAELRTGEEGQEGMRAFLEKRTPKWLSEDNQ